MCLFFQLSSDKKFAEQCLKNTIKNKNVTFDSHLKKIYSNGCL